MFTLQEQVRGFYLIDKLFNTWAWAQWIFTNTLNFYSWSVRLSLPGTITSRNFFLIPQFWSKWAAILHLNSSGRCLSVAPKFAATILQTILNKNRKSTISQLLDKNSKIWLVTYLWAKFQPSSFKIKIGVWGYRHVDDIFFPADPLYMRAIHSDFSDLPLLASLINGGLIFRNFQNLNKWVALMKWHIFDEKTRYFYLHPIFNPGESQKLATP